MIRKKKTILFLTVLLLCAGATTRVFAQRVVNVSIRGTVSEVTEEGTTVGIPYAAVKILGTGQIAVANERGEYTFKSITPSTYDISVECLGYETLKTTLTINSAREEYNFSLKTADFYLDNVIVTAVASKAGAATASKIDRTAIEHLQATSLADVMILLPGADITSSNFKPDLQGVKTQSIRGGQSFGTAVIMDGAPLSNSANMQMMAAAIGGSTTGAVGVTPSSGIDLRTITTDNVESVEVIGGIASVEYGDATSGTVIVNAKSGVEPLTIRFNTNPNIYSIGATHGVSLGENNGFLNYGVDYAYSVDDPRAAYDKYKRATARVAYANSFFDKRLYTNTSLSFIWARDKSTPNPDDSNDFTTSIGRETSIRIAHNGDFAVNKGWFKNIKYTLSFNYTNRKSYYQDDALNADVAYSFVESDGTVLSSVPGAHIYDTDGNEITNFGSDYAASRSWITPAEYMYEYNVYGKELNTFAKVVANFSGKLGATDHHIIIGGDWSNDGNVGVGKVFDYDCPPWRSVSYTFATQRERSYKDIPFMNKLGAYAEETFSVPIRGHDFFKLVAGARYDYVKDLGSGIAPRLNASLEIIPGILSLRGGYGVNFKAPSVAYLYPQNAYFDMTNFNNASSSSVADEQKFQVITTHVYSTTNEELELAKVKKYEVGVDFSWKKMNFAITAYKDICNNGYSFSKTLDSYGYEPFITYKASSYPDDGSLPDLIVSGTDNYFLWYTKPTNNHAYERKGIEFTLDFGRWDAIRTSFLLNGEYYDHSTWSNGYVFYNKGGLENSSYGVYSSKNSSGIDRERNIITNLIVTHNIPKLGLVISVTANVNWRYKGWTTYGENDDVPLYVLDISTGSVVDYKTYLAAVGEDTSILRNEDNGAISSDRRVVEPSYNPVLCINTNITKQFKLFDVSFFANNVFHSTPLQSLVKSPGSKTRRNSGVFFFGLQLTTRIK